MVLLSAIKIMVKESGDHQLADEHVIFYST